MKAAIDMTFHISVCEPNF